MNFRISGKFFRKIANFSHRIRWSKIKLKDEKCFTHQINHKTWFNCSKFWKNHDIGEIGYAGSQAGRVTRIADPARGWRRPRTNLPTRIPGACNARANEKLLILKFKSSSMLHVPRPIFLDIFHDFLKLKIILLLFIYFIYVLS